MSKVRAIHPTQPLLDVRVVILTGTLVPSLGRSLYQPLVKFFLGVRGYLTDVVCIPRLGLGDLDEANDELAEVIFAAHPNSRFILVGHSQGGLHAILLAHRFPDRVVAGANFAHGHLLDPMHHESTLSVT
jgi:pimeloyl-ACP methyl ester carboxylesterase